MVGIYRSWPDATALDASPESLVTAPAGVATELLPHYWRALGHLAGRYWYENDRSLSQLNTHLQAFVPRLDPPVQRYVLQGVGEALFHHLMMAPGATAAELERFPHAYQDGLLEGWGMTLAEEELSFISPREGDESVLWIASTKGLSARSLSYVRQGKAQFEALFEGPDPTALKPPRQAH